jgi:hypothetical protein
MISGDRWMAAGGRKIIKIHSLEEPGVDFK